jgi:hypothetical protein
MWNPLKSVERQGGEVKDVEFVKAKALYNRQVFITATK